MKLKIGHNNITVTPLSTGQAVDSGNWGEFNARLGTISVYDGVQPSEQVRILLHELLHAIWWSMNVPADPTEEQVVERLDRGLAALLVDNPELLGIIHQGLANGKPLFGSRKPAKAS